MNTKTTKQKFLSLRLSGLTLKSIAETLGVSMSTVCRWNKKYSDEILKLKTKNVNAVGESLLPKIDRYFEFFEKNFVILQKELDKHKDFIMPYDKVIRNSVRVMNVLQKLITLKRSLSFSVNPSDLQNEFLNSDDNENDISCDMCETDTNV